MLVDRFLEDAIELDVDALCDGYEVFLGGVMEHIEEAGIHSREYWSQLLTILITMPINFIVNKLWTFRAVRNRHHARSTANAVV